MGSSILGCFFDRVLNSRRLRATFFLRIGPSWLTPALGKIWRNTRSIWSNVVPNISFSCRMHQTFISNTLFLVASLRKCKETSKDINLHFPDLTRYPPAVQVRPVRSCVFHQIHHQRVLREVWWLFQYFLLKFRELGNWSETDETDDFGPLEMRSKHIYIYIIISYYIILY